MSTEAIKVKLEDNSYCYFEVENISGREEISGEEEEFDFATIKHQVTSISENMLAVLKSVKPTSASIEFGVELSVESGKLTSLIVKGSGKANLKITLNWNKPGE